MVTYWKSVLRTVRSSLSRFLAIFAIVALAVMFLSGLLVSTPYMRYSVGQFNNNTALMDLRIISTLGLTQEDADAVSRIEGVGAVMPAYTVDAEMLTPDGKSITTRIHSVKGTYWGSDDPGYLNRTVLTGGRWPRNETECVIEGMDQDAALALLGCPLQVSSNAADSGLSAQTLTVVGTVQSACYLSKAQLGNTSVGTGSLACILYADEACFDLEVYTDLYLTVEGAGDCAPYSREYDEWVDRVQARVEHLGKTQRLVRRDQILEEATGQLDEAKAALAAQEESGRIELEAATLELAKGEWQLEAAYAQLAAGQAELDAGKAELEQGKAELDANAVLLEDAGAQLESGQAQIDAGRAELDAGQAQLEQGKAQLESAQDTLDSMESLVSGVEVLQNMVDGGYVSSVVYGPIRLMCIAFADEMEPQVAALRANPSPTATEQFLLDFYDLARALEEIDPLSLDRTEQLTALADEMQAVRAGYAAAQAELNANRAELEQAEQELKQGRAQLDEAQNQLNAKRAEYIEGLSALAQGRQELADAQQALSSAEAELASGWAEYRSGKTTLASGKAELEEQKALFRREVARGQREIEDAEAELHAMEDPEWYVLDRGTVMAYVNFDSDSGKVGAISRVFPIFFFLVAALVTSSTMTRMVEEERGQIGLLKALGYGNGVIAGKFLSYAAAASLLGTVVGLPFGLTVFPLVIYSAYGSAYYLPEMLYTNPLLVSVLSAGLILLAILAATAGALVAALREHSALLMRPKAPPAGKRILLERIPSLWRKFPFTWKVTARNLFRYKKRLFMTLLGVAGCTALLVAALGLRNSIGGITDRQFRDIQTYTLSLTLRKAGDDTANEELAELLNDPHYVQQYAAFHSETAVIPGPEEDLSVYVVAPADLDTLPDFIDFHHRTDHKPVTLEADTVILSEKTASLLGVKKGDTFLLRDNDEQEISLKVGDIMENYIFGYVYMTQSLFQESFGRDCDFSTLYLRTNNDTLNSPAAQDDFAKALIGTGSVTGVVYNTSVVTAFDAVVDSIDYIVLLILLFSAALALVVLYNLTNINITERQKELATLKVLGFQRGELSAYIFREGVILTLLGSLAGLALGKVLLLFIIQVIEMSNIMFGRIIEPQSYILSFAVTMGFSLLVNLLMEGKLRRINMAESLKAPE